MRDRGAERSAACATCGKTFARSDTLLRHEKSHRTTEDRGPVHRVTNGTFRACRLCAQARARCSGGLPCGRCKVRDLECTYPSKRRKVTDESETASTAHERAMEQAMQSVPANSGHTLQPLPMQFEEIVFSQKPENTSVVKSFDKPESSSQNTDPRQNGEPTAANPRPGDMMYSSNLNQPMNQSQYESRPQLSTANVMSFAQPVPQRGDYATTTDQDFQANFGTPNPMFPYDAGFNENASLNWIPLSVYSSPYGDLEQDFSFFVPPFSDSVSLGTAYDPSNFESRGSNTNLTFQPDIQLQNVPLDAQTSIPRFAFSRSPASSTSEGFSTVRSFQGDTTGQETRRKVKKIPRTQHDPKKPQSSDDEFRFPDTSELLPVNLEAQYCDESQYLNLQKAFDSLCTTSAYGQPFSPLQFPSLLTVNALIGLYFENFHDNFPLVHAHTFGSNTAWINTLAVAVVGSNFASLEYQPDLKDAFAEFLRRAIISTSDAESLTFRHCELMQARVLNLVNLSQSNRLKLRSLAPKYHADVSRWCLESGVLQLTQMDEIFLPDPSAEQKAIYWQKWIQRETIHRIGYFIWFLDCAFGYLCNARPLCNMDDARTPLPCPEALWNASSAEEWFGLNLKTPTMPSLCSALEEMYNTKKLMSGMSEICYTLLVHALYSRTWEVGTHIKQPLSEWKSTGNARGFLNTPSKDDFWLPLYPLYANWRNSACDCLDNLHWHATGVSAQASGFEHHGILQLHLARIILLTPFQEIQDLLFFLIDHDVGDDSKATYYVHDGSYQRRNPAKHSQIRKITWRWLKEDQHKARLAMVHAGSVFWHVRRYSSKSFFEPLAIYLASIVLWTYGSYKSAALDRAAADGNGQTKNSTTSAHEDQRQHHQRQEVHNVDVQPSRVEIAAQSYGSRKTSALASHPITSPRPTTNTNSHAAAKHNQDQGDLSLVSEDNSERVEDEDENEEDQPQFIHLDRPCDDEIVQHFVRNGHNMAGYMTNVDICKTPGKVLAEGAKLLKTKLGCWGVSRTYYDILCQVGKPRKTGKESANTM